MPHRDPHRPKPQPQDPGGRSPTPSSPRPARGCRAEFRAEEKTAPRGRSVARALGPTPHSVRKAAGAPRAPERGSPRGPASPSWKGQERDGAGGATWPTPRVGLLPSDGQGRPPRQGRTVSCRKRHVVIRSDFQGELMKNVRDRAHPAGHPGGCLGVPPVTLLPTSRGLRGKGVTMSTLRLRGSNSERPSSCPRSHSSGQLSTGLCPVTPAGCHLPGLSTAACLPLSRGSSQAPAQGAG